MKTYATNRGVNRPMEFRGLQAQYIFWLVGVVLGDLLLFAVLHLCGLNSWICLPVVLGLGGAGIAGVYRLSKKYGRYGLMKRRAAKCLPTALRSRSKAIFQHSNNNYGKRTK
jgi:hypothetical protein